MHKFMALMKNEYIKILKKTSSKVFLVLMFLSVIFIALQTLPSRPYDISRAKKNTNTTVDRHIDLRHKLEDEKPPYYQEKIDLLKEITLYNLYSGSWQEQAILSIVNTDLSSEDEFPVETVKKIKEYITTDDWQGYFELALKEQKLSAGTKWKYKFCIEKNAAPDDSSWRAELINDVQKTLDSSEKNNDLSKVQKDELALWTYQLENDIAINLSDYHSDNFIVSLFRGNKWSMWMGYSFLIHAVTILLIIFASGSVANEYSHGTIKFLLVNPVKRWKILLSKYCTIISMGIILTAIVFIICGIIASISDFDNSLKAASLTVKDAQVHRSSAFFVVFKTWALNSLTMLVVVTFTFSVSSFTRKSAAAITLSLVFLLLGATLSSFLSATDSDWGRFLLFSNLDIQNIADGNPLFYGQTVEFAVFVIIEHMAVFLITAFDAFNKKDI